MGQYKDGRKRYEYRHVNDVKAAHPDSMAAPMHRPTLGRPPTSTSKPQLKPPTSPNPPNMVASPSPSNSKQTVTNARPVNYRATSTNVESQHSSENNESGKFKPSSTPDADLQLQVPEKGPLITKQMFDSADWPKILDIPNSSRPVRSTRNPAPNYIDGIQWASVRPWSASTAVIVF